MATILLVEDEEPIQELIGTFLQDEGYEVMAAYHGAQGLGLARTARPDLVLTDLMMPIMNGVELCRQLKSDAATRDVPIVIMSAAGREQADHCGAEAFLSKPFRLEDLLALVARYTGPPTGPAPDPAGS